MLAKKHASVLNSFLKPLGKCSHLWADKEASEEVGVSGDLEKRGQHRQRRLTLLTAQLLLQQTASRVLFPSVT